MSIIPENRPKLTKEEAEKIVKYHLGANCPPIVLIGIRGYYSKSLGATEGNDINIYDDAMIVWGLDLFKTFNANTDPSFSNKGLAKLNEGVYKFYKGKHKGKYNALRSYPEGVSLPCTRDGRESACSAINIHHGGIRGTDTVWSAGCQTLPPTQWEEFIETVYASMTKAQIKVITYILISQEKMQKILTA
jgi:hypothetical protein